MDGKKIESIRESYQRCISEGLIFTEFYDHFLKASDEIAVHFQDTVMIKQKAMLAEGIFRVINYAETGKPCERLVEIVKMHDKDHLNINPSLYSQFKTHLLAAIEKVDPEYSEELGQAWAEALETGIEYFTSQY